MCYIIVVISGKQRHVRLIPVRALDGDECEWIKVSETKGCITLVSAQSLFTVLKQLNNYICNSGNWSNATRPTNRILSLCRRQETKYKPGRNTNLVFQSQFSM